MQPDSLTKVNKKINSLFSSSTTSWIVISVGIVIRVIQYLYNRSLWADEAVLALNIGNRSYLELLQPLNYEQGAPIGFLWMEKLAIQVFGNNEYALRLFPLFSGLISLFLFYKLAKKCIPKAAILIALVLFSSLPYLVYYASEVKQYSTDVAVALLSCLIALRLSRKLTTAQTLIFSLVGAIAIWFSHPAIFVLVGVGITTLLIGIVKKHQLNLTHILVILSTWSCSFAALYFISLRNLGSSEDLLKSWLKKSAFPSSSIDIIWIFDSLGRFFSNPLGFTAFFDGLAILAFLLGCISCFHRRKEVLFTLLSPIVATLIAAYLHKYPFSNRLVLFLTPFIILLIAEGINYSWQITRYKFTFVLSVFVSILLLVPPVVNASNLLTTPILKEEIKPVMSYVKTHQKPGDILYIFQRGEYQFKYYAKKYGYQDKDYIIGIDDLDKYDGRKVSQAEWKRYQSDLDRLRGNKRVWLIFSHAYLRTENEMIKSYLDAIGQQIDTFESYGAFVYLYDLS